jgi:hypothetical protein
MGFISGIAVVKNILIPSSEITEDKLNISNVTTKNATTSAHGFCPKGDANAAHFLNGDLAWAVAGGTTFTLLGSGQETTTNSVAHDGVQFSVGAGSLGSNDMIFYLIQAYGATSCSPFFRLRIYDGTNTYDMAELGGSGGGANPKYVYGFIAARQGDATKAINQYYYNDEQGSNAGFVAAVEYPTLINNWITSALTVTLRTRSSIGSEVYYKIWAWKLSAT